MKLLQRTLILFWAGPVITLYSQSVYLIEGFENGSKPDGWTAEAVSGNEPWRYRNGGHSPNDNNWQVPAWQVDITRNPPSAYEGTYNAIFFKQGDNNERTKLVTPPMNMMGATTVELSFFLCQIPWSFEGSTGWDILRVYYKVSESGPWVLLQEYLDPVYDWEEQRLTLPNPSEAYYVAFEGHTRWGFGTCIDSVSIRETGLQPLYVAGMDFEQPFPSFTPSGASDVPLMRIDLTVFGNSDSLLLESMNVKSLNTSDSDVITGGVKLYVTSTQEFSRDHQLGAPAGFSGGTAGFTGLNHSLPAGHTYVWVTCDVAPDAINGNVLDLRVEADAITTSGGTYPDAVQSPAGYRQIFSTIYHEGFEGVHNWTLTGEFEVDSPAGTGGEPGNPDPSNAYSGTRSLGTDLTGLGSSPYNYEPDLSESNADLATSPNVNVLYHKNLNLYFRRQLNIEVWDKAAIGISNDDGVSWNTLWENDAYVSDFQWFPEQLTIPDMYARTDRFRIRFKLGPTDGFQNYSGWNIDDIFLTGEFISKDVGVSEWIRPLSGSGHTSADSVTVRINNFGGAGIMDPVPVAYSFDGGDTWTVDQLDTDIPVGSSVVYTFPTPADLSGPGLRSVIAKTTLPGDQFRGNDQVSTEIFIVPTYTLPYHEDFESGDGYWRSNGNDIWEYGFPAGNVINTAWSGSSVWATGLTGRYGDLLTDVGRTIFEDDFESDRGWSLTGEFERAQPSNLYVPYFAGSGYYCLGTDLSGQGAYPYEYENGVTPATAYSAITPALDVTGYSNLYISFNSWIEVQTGDSLKLELSVDNGTTWHSLWKNDGEAVSDMGFIPFGFYVPDSFTYTDALRIRFSLYYSSAAGIVAPGWNIDDFSITGDLVDSAPGELVSPAFDLTGISNPLLTANIWVESELNVDGVSLFYSLDDGENWNIVSNSSGYDSYWNWYTGRSISSLGQDGWSGNTGGWISVRHLLPPEVIHRENVRLSFVFGADKIDNRYDGAALDDIRIIEAPQDLDILEIPGPVSACELTANERFTLRIRNSGPEDLSPGDTVRMGYYIDRNGEVQTAGETYILITSLPVGGTRDILFNSIFDFSTSGNYSAEVFITNQDPHFYGPVSNDTIRNLIQVRKPAVDLGEDISTVRPDTVVLRAYSGVPGQAYLWQDMSTDSVYHVSTDGTYYVRVTNDLGCSAYDTVRVMQLMADVGISALTGPISACELGNQVPVEFTIMNFGTDTVEVNDTIFVSGEINSNYFGDTLLVTDRFTPGETMAYTFPELFDFSVQGVYRMKLFTRLKNDITHQNDTMNYDLQVYGYPEVNLGPDTVVRASEYLLDPAPGYFGYIWQDGSTGETFMVNKPGPGVYHVTVSDENQCTSTDTVMVNLNVLDLALDLILSPATSCEVSESITVSARIRNTGNQAIPAGETIDMGYLINGGSLFMDATTLPGDLLPGAELDFVFSKTEPVQTGQWYDFTIFVDYSNDSKSWNDTLHTSVGVFEAPPLDLGPDYQVVTELEYTLDAGPGFVTYQWQDGSTGQTFTITEPGIGTYGITATDVNGCVIYDEVVVMLALPDVGILEITQPKTACRLGTEEYIQVAVKNYGNWDIEPGASITISYSLDGANAVTENLVLESAFGNGAVIYHTFGKAEDFSEPRRYEIMAYTEYASDLIPVNDIVLVNVDHLGSPVIDINNGEDTLFTDAPLTLSVTGGYSSYLWQDGSTGTDFEITGPSAALYHVTVTAPNGCATKDSVLVVWDRPDLAVSRILSPVSSCTLDEDQSISMEVMNNGYYRIATEDTLIITFSVNGGGSVFEQVQLDEELQPGQSTRITFTAGYDFSSVRNYQIQMSLIWKPDKNLSNNLLTETVRVWGYPDVEIGGGLQTLWATFPHLLDAGGGFSSYLWQDQSTGRTFQVIQPGLYWVEVTNQYGCAERDSVFVEEVTSSNGVISNQEKLNIYPNPVQDMLYLSFDMDVQGRVILEAYSITNSLVYRSDIITPGITEARIDVRNWMPGTYYLRVLADDIPFHFMVIVE